MFGIKKVRHTVEDAGRTVTATAVLAVAALVIGLLALIVGVVQWPKVS